MSDKQRRRGHNEGTGYQRKDGRWEWRVTLPDDSRRSYYAPTQRQAREKATRALKDLADGLDLTTERMTVATYLERWLADTAAQRVRPSTLEGYRSHIERHLIPALGHHRIRVLSPAHVNKLLAELVAGGTAPATTNRIRATLRTALASAVKAGYVSKNVAALADARTERKTRIEPLTLAQIHTLLDATAGTRQGALYHVALATGLRQGGCSRCGGRISTLTSAFCAYGTGSHAGRAASCPLARTPGHSPIRKRMATGGRCG